MENLYRTKLALETGLKCRNEIFDIEPSEEEAYKVELMMTDSQIDKNEYEKWKVDFINNQFAKVKDCNWKTVHYLFAGTGSYQKTMPLSEVAYFKEYIKSNGSGFLGSVDDATEDEIKTAICLNAENL